MPNVRIMSWNVEKFGADKAAMEGGRSPMCEFVAEVVRTRAVDLLGLMELVGGNGFAVAQRIADLYLNTVAAPVGPPDPKRPNLDGRGNNWDRVVSPRQDGGTQEEYAYIWNAPTYDFNADESKAGGAFWLPGVISQRNFQNITAGLGYSADDWENFFISIEAQELIKKILFVNKGRSRCETTTYRVDPARWSELNDGQGADVVENHGMPKGGLSPAALNAVGNVIWLTDILRFPNTGDRSPYLGWFRCWNSTLLVGMLHAPGPQDQNRFEGINNMNLWQALRDAPNALIMGDFNINAPAETKSSKLEYRVNDANATDTGKLVFSSKPPRFARVFAPLTAALHAPIADNQNPAQNEGLGMTRQLNNVGTTVVATVLPPDATARQAMASTYDNFFYRAAAAAADNPMTVSQAAAVCDLLTDITSPGPGLQAPQPNLALLAMQVFRLWGGADRVRRQIAEMRGGKPLLRAQAKLRAATTSAARATATANANPLSQAAQTRMIQQNAALAAAQTAVNNLTTQADLLENTYLPLFDNAAFVVSNSIGCSAFIFSRAISDHLPILIGLQTP